MGKPVVLFILLLGCSLFSFAQPSEPKAERLGPTINTPYNEHRPVISPDGQSLFFSRKNHPQNIGDDDLEDIWVAYRQSNNSWSKAINLGQPMNNHEANFAVSVSPDGQQLYLQGNYHTADQMGISLSTRRGRSWSSPRNMPITDYPYDSPFANYHLSVDGQTLLLSTYGSDSLGQADLYVCFRKNNQWSPPLNLGPMINSDGDERSVFLAADSQTLYFSSDSHEGYGGLDMFITHRLDSTWTNWSTPQNMGPAINNEKDNAYFSIPASGNYAYFATEDENGQSDIFRIDLPADLQPRPVVLLSGHIIDGETRRPLRAQLRMQSLDNPESQNPTDSEKETFHMVLPYGTDFSLYAEREGYFSVSESMELSEQGVEELDGKEEGMMAMITGEVFYSNRNLEVERLQMRLTRLSKEVQELDKLRRSQAYKLPKDANNPQAQRRLDPELEALRHRYNEVMRQKADTQVHRSNISEKSDADDAELSKMRQKLDQYQQSREEPIQQAPATPAEADEELLELRRRYNQHYKGQTKVSSTTVSPLSSPQSDQFETMEAQIRSQLELELYPDVIKVLQKEHFNQLVAEYQRNNIDRLNKSMRNEAWAQLQQYTKQLIADQVAPKTPYTDKQLAELAQSIRPLLREEVRTKLRKKLSPQIKRRIKSELEYQLKKKTEAQLQEELNVKIRKLVREEKRQTAASISKNNGLNGNPINSPFYQEMEKDILLLPVKVGQVIPMNNIFFNANTAVLKAASLKELQRVLKFLTNNPGLSVEVGGHTNGSCDQGFANYISFERAKVVAEYFIANGLAEKQVRYKGFGRNRPIATNDTIEGRKKNQRIELTILDME